MAYWFSELSRGSRTAVIVLLLLVSLATAALIAFQAQSADASRRAAAENVLQDYTALVADEVIRRSEGEIGFYGCYPLAGLLLRKLGPTAELPRDTAAVLLAAQDAGERRAATLAKSYFSMKSPAAQIDFRGQAPPGAVSSWLRPALAQFSLGPPGGPFKVFHAPTGSPSRMFVAAQARKAGSGPAIVGFEVDPASLTKWIDTALNRQPLVPPSLGHGRVTNALVRVSIRDPSGGESYRLGAVSPQGLVVAKPFGDGYQGIFSGFTVEASFAPEVAEQVVVGGLPPSRQPLFLGLLALNAVLILSAILQLRREMALQKLRDEFVSSVSHELRTPLTQIRMFTETLLLDRIRSPEEGRRSLEIIDREARRLAQLVENVLQFSRMDHKGGVLPHDQHELAPLILEFVEDFESSLSEDEAKIDTRLAPGLIANLEPGGLRQILLNLLDNAIKYGRKGQRVIVGLEAGGGVARLFVDDEGPGIPPADRRRIFERFQRLERHTQSAIAGTGIGLSVVRDLAGRHGGRCWAAAGDRGGARFVVEIPLCAADQRPSGQHAEKSS